MTSTLSDTVALVTGASSGIGHATALALAEAGASIALVARRKHRIEELAETIRSLGGTALAIPADLADREQAQDAVARAVTHFGRLDILVNNAGYMILGPVAGADVTQWDRMIAVNQQALLYTTHAALPHLIAAAGDGPRQVADVVNISSIAGRTAFPAMAVYNMTKFGVNGFTESLRQELAAQRVRVGVLEPGKVDTELDSHNSPEIIDHIQANFGSFQMLRPEDIADGVSYMVSRPAHAAIAELWIMPSEQG